MIRYHEHINLSSSDLALFATLTGADQPPPANVAEYNRRLRAAANTWRQGRSQEEGLLLEITEGLLFNEDHVDPQTALAAHFDD
jgi:hypothetical protein